MKSFRKSNPRRVVQFLMVLCAFGILSSASIILINSRDYTKSDSGYQQLRLIREASSTEKQEEQTTGVDFSALEKINPDVVGWIVAEGSEIDYPVVRGIDNDFYLNHMFTGERNKLGSVFMDYRNQIDFSDKNTIVYGHNMKDGSMFSSLTKYKDQRYYDDFPTMLLNTSVGDFTIELFAGNVVDGSYESIQIDFKDDQEFDDYIDSLKDNSTFETDTMIDSDDKIITLCTCSYEFSNARFALYGKLTPVL